MRRLIALAYVVADTRRERVPGTTSMLDEKLAGKNEHDMALVTPVVCNVVGAVGDKAKPDIPNLVHTHHGNTRFARTRRRRKLCPIRDAGGQIAEIHVVILTLPLLSPKMRFQTCRSRISRKIKSTHVFLLRQHTPQSGTHVQPSRIKKRYAVTRLLQKQWQLRSSENHPLRLPLLGQPIDNP
jgi:hypothetical protein